MGSMGTQHFVERKLGGIGGRCGARSSLMEGWMVMAPLARVEVFAVDEIAIVHVVNHTVRRCFLPGNDPFSRKNFDHRRVWLDEQLK